MAQSYTRQSSMSDGDTITAALFNNEYNQLVNAFTYSSSSASTTGHRHDGTAGHGGNIHTIGDLDFLNKIVADSTNNRWGVFVEVSSAAVEQIRIADGVVSPVTDNDIDLGTSSLEFKDLFIDGTAHIDTLDVDVNGTVAGTFGVTGATTLSSTLAVTGAVTGSSTLQGTTITATTAFVPDASDGAALGTSALEFSDLFLADGAVINFGDDQDVSLTHVVDTGLLLSSTDQLQFGDSGTYIYQSADGVLDLVSDTEIELTATTIDINGAVAMDGAITGGTNITISGELDAATLDISGNADIDGTLEADAITIGGVTLAETIADTVGAMVSSNTESGITVAYQDGDNTLDFTVGTLNQDTTGTAAIATTVTITDNESTNESNAVIFTAGGDVDGGNLGLESDGNLTYNPSSGTLTATAFAGALTGNVTGNASGTAATVTTAAQSNITSLGTLTTLTVDNVIINGSTIGHTGDTDLITVASGIATVAGEVSMTTLDIGGTNVTADASELNILDGKAFLDEDDLSSDSATGIASQQSIKAYVDGQDFAATSFVLEDGDGTEVTITKNKEIKFIEGGGVDINWTDTDNGTDGDPYDLTFTVNAAQTGITSLLATDIKIGEDDQTKIDFETADTINFYAGNEKQLILTDGALTPGSNAIVDLGTDALEFKDAYFDGTVEADAITIGGTGIGSIYSAIAGSSSIVTVGTIGTGVWQGTAIASAYIAADAITGAKIADDAIDSEHYTDGSIDNAHIADDAIDSEHYAAGSIDTAHIADNQITLAKMAGGTDGNIISYDASGDPVAIATGSDGQVLTSTGAGSPPAFEDASGVSTGKAIAMAMVFG